MANIRKITQIGDPLLRKTAVPVKRFDDSLARLLDDLTYTLQNLEGVGLAAPQVGVSKRAFVVNIGEGAHEFINPRLECSEEKELGSEGCFSIPGRQGLVERSLKVTVTAQDRHGKEFTEAYEGLFARALQHEYDHLDGRLFVDIMTEEEFD